MKILITGDIHAEWNKLNDLINQKKPDVILQCGDFGYWPKWHGCKMSVGHNIKPFNQFGTKPKNTKIYFCDGNHEDHPALLTLENNEIQPNVFYMKRGSILELNGKNILFMGGADSVDKLVRTPGRDWFPEELITQKNIWDLPDPSFTKIDVVISHTCPNYFGKVLNDSYKITDPSRAALDVVFDMFHPKQWFFAHWHIHKHGVYKGCQWRCLNMAGRTDWWIEMKG